MLLNNDVEVDKNCIANLRNAMETDARIGICAAKMIVSGTQMIDSAGDGFSANLKGFKRGEGMSSSHCYNKEEFVFGACAGAALYRRTMIEEIGFMDEDFFLIQEDTDLNFRAQLAGWKVMYVPSAVVYHRVRSTIGHMSDMAIYYTLRNGEFVRIKNIPFAVFLRYLPEFVFGEFLDFVYFAVKHGKLATYIKAKFDVFKSLRMTLKKRKNIMKGIKKVDNKYVQSIITPVWNREFLASKIRKFLHG
jgi:GT2 family glycosyltransferase